MFVIDVSIVRWLSDDYPGVVECELTDRFGKVWHFIEKLPVVSTHDLNAGSAYPQPGIIACDVTKRGTDGARREIAKTDTNTPWGVESVEGNTHFHVFMDQLMELSGR